MIMIFQTAMHFIPDIFYEKKKIERTIYRQLHKKNFFLSNKKTKHIISLVFEVFQSNKK